MVAVEVTLQQQHLGTATVEAGIAGRPRNDTEPAQPFGMLRLVFPAREAEMTLVLAKNGAERLPVALDLARHGFEVSVRQPMGMGMQLDVESAGVELEKLFARH